MHPSEVGKNILRQITRLDKIAFVTVWILGLSTHLRIFMHDIPNHDGMDSICFDQNMIALGRWFLSPVAGISSDFTLPWLIGLLSLLYMSIMAVVLCRFYRIKHGYSAAIISGLLVAFPTLTSSFAHIYVADAYSLAMLLAVVAVCLVERGKKGFIVGGVLLGFSLGIYQAYLAIAMILSVFAVTRIWLMEKKLKERLIGIVRYLAMGSIGGVVYVVMLQVSLWIQQAELSGYQGIGVKQSVSLVERVGIIYKTFISYYTLKNTLLTSNITILFLAVLFLISIISLWHIIKKKGMSKNLLFYVYTIVVSLLIPVYFNVILLISPNVNYHSLMRYHWVLIPITAIAVIDIGDDYIVKVKKKVVLQWVTLVIGLVMVGQYIVASHISYFNLEKMYTKTYTYTLRLLEQMEETQGYYHGMPVAMIGVVGDDYLPSTSLTKESTENLLGVDGDYLFYRADNYQLFMKYYFGVTIELVDIQMMPEIVQKEEYKSLNTFPKENSMEVVDGILYIKLENQQ